MDIDDTAIDFNNFRSSTSTSCDSPTKPLTKETFTKMLESIKEALDKDAIAYKSKSGLKLGVGQMISFDSIMFSRIHTS